MLLEISEVIRYFGDGSAGRRRNVLDGISLSVNEGDAIAIVGPSGSGKSTLLHIMGTLDSPNSGRVVFRDREVGSLKEQELAMTRNKHIGFVFQLHYLLPQLSLLENVLLPVIPRQDKALMKQAGERANDLLQLAGLGDIYSRLPGQCSVGECQRAAVVRALINEPELILADEPTGSLDHHTATQIGDLLKDLNRKFSVALVVVTHSLELAQRMDTVYRLENGKLLAGGS